MFHRLRPLSCTLLSIALALSTVPSPAGEVSRWTLDDTLQDSIGPNDGAYGGGAAPSFVAGHDGTGQGALSLNAVAGLTERVALPEGAGLPIWANPRHSVTAWVKGSPRANQVLYSESKAGDSSVVFQIGFDPSGATGRVHVLVRSGGAAALIDAILSTTNVLDGAWHHIAWVDDNGSARLYVDGAVEGTFSYARPALTLERITIGATSGALGYSSFLKAAVDDVRVFDHALSAAEVQAMVPVPCPPVVIHLTGPPTVLNCGGTEFVIMGTGFVQGRHFGYIGDQPLTDQVLTVGAPLQGSTIAGKSPPLPNGFHTPSVRCADGAIAHAAGRAEAVPPPRPAINAIAVRPAGGKVVDVQGGQTVDVNGISFTQTMELAMIDAAGAMVLEWTYLNGNNLIFTTPPHAEGPIDLRFTVCGAEPVVVRNALQYVLIRPELRSWPTSLPAEGGTGLVLDGVNFTRTMELSIKDAVRTIPLTFTQDGSFPANRVYVDAPPHRPGFVDLCVRDGAKPPFVVARAIEYRPLPRPGINFASPNRVSTAGGEEVTVGGVAFPKPIPELMPMELALVEAAGATTLVLSYTYLNVQRVSFVAPPHAAGKVGLQARVEGQEPYVLAEAIEYVLFPPKLISVEPNVISAAGRAGLALNGENFTPSMQLSMVDATGVIPLDFTPNKPAEFMPENARQVFFNAPPHSPGVVGLRVSDGVNPPFELAPAIVYQPLPRPSISKVEPNQVSTVGGQEVKVEGANFHESMELAMVDATGALIPLAFKPAEFMPENATLVYFDAPPHAAGVVGLRVSVVGQDHFDRPDALKYVAPAGPEITSFTPAHVDARGGESIAVRGRNFTATTQVVIHAVGAAGPNYEKVESEFVNDALITALMPAHKPAEFIVGVRASDGADPTFAPGVLEFVDPAAPAPQEVEATLVDGIAEMEWVNPVPYARVHVYRDGEFHGTLEGNATSFRDTEPVEGSQVGFMLVGEVEGGGSGVALFHVARPACVPPANVTEGAPGEKILHVDGGHAPFGPGGGASGGSGGYQFVLISPEGQPHINYDISPLTTPVANELVTGFRLVETTRKLRIGVHAAKVAAVESQSLRVLIETAEPGMVWGPVELTLPNVPLDPQHRWIVLDYNTQNPPPPGSPVPDEKNPQPPHDQLPPGAYLLRIYAVGGDPLTTTFEVSSDRSTEQIIVPGAGCPPYPLVRVEPTNNFNPTIHGIHQFLPATEVQGGELHMTDGTVIPLLTATIHAKVSDLDGDPIVKYVWDVYNGGDTQWGPQVDHYESASDKFTTFFYGYGTHSATLKVWDNRCGNTTETQIPVTIHPPCVSDEDGPNFTFPSPVPGKLHFVTDLGSLDYVADEVVQTFQIFVVDPQAGADCTGAATTQRVQTMLFRAGGPNSPVQTQPAYLQGIDSQKKPCLVHEFTIDEGIGLDEDGKECTYDTEIGGRFWVARYDMSDLPRVDPGVAGAVGVYELWAWGSDDPNGSNPSPWRPVRDYRQVEVGGSKIFEAVPGSESINVYDPPASLDHSPFTTASYDPPSRVYDFAAFMAPPGSGTPIYKSDAVHEVNNGVPFGYPATNNGLRSAEATVYMTFSNGAWQLDRLRKAYQVHAMGKKYRSRVDISAANLDPPSQLAPAGGGGGGGAWDSACNLKAFRDCSFNTFVDEGGEIPVFKMPIFTDPFGGVVFAVSFATGVSGFLVVAAGHDITFDPCPSGNDPSFDARFFFDLEGGAGIFAEVDADVVLGVLSGAIGIDFGFEAQLPVIMSLTNFTAPEFGFLLSVDLDGYLRGCVAGICEKVSWDIWKGLILEVPEDDNGVTAAEVAGEIAVLKAICGSITGLAPGAPAGGGGQVPLSAPRRQLAIATSPNGFRQIAVGRNDSGHLFSIIKGTSSDWQWPPDDVVLPTAQTAEYSGPQADPEVVFMDNDKILLVWTQNFMREDSTLAGIQEKDLKDPQIFNKVMRRTEVAFSIGTWSHKQNPEPNKPPIPYVAWSTAQRLTNDLGPNGYRADGKVSLALDPTTVNGPNGPGVWAAWVRYEAADMVQLDQNGDPQMQLRKTSIYARQIFTAFAAPRVKISSNADEIDIEPNIAVGPDGTTFIVWLNDPIHENLLGENIGREILYSRRTGNNIFSAPAPVLASASDFKGLLEPTIALGAQGHGLLAFTALPVNAETTDPGFGGIRVLYSATITGADTAPQFGDPLLIGPKCDTPIFAHSPKVQNLVLVGAGDEDPTFAVTFQQRGSIGSRAGAGNAIAMVYSGGMQSWGDPVNLTPDNRVHQDIAATFTSAGEIVLMHQSPAPLHGDLALAEAQGGGLGDSVPVPVLGGHLFGDLMGQSFPAVADPAISVCRVSDVYAAAGSDLKATIHVANRGFAPTPADLSLTLFHESDSGVRDAIENVVIRVLEPGEESVFEVPFTMPRRPVLFAAVVDGVKGEFNPADNERVCPIGAQKPRDLSGEAITVRGEPAVVLRWTNGGIYDRVQIYRDGQMHAEVSGTRSSFVDSGTAGIDPRAGLVDKHEYCVRGSIGLSQSVKSEPITVRLAPPPPPPARFIRTDANGDGGKDITDAVYTLSFLFTGGPPPACAAASDANSDLTVDLTDVVYTLNHLFLGGPPPRAPYPGCGVNPEPDGLDCESFAGCEGR